MQYALYLQGTAVIVDVRDDNEYTAGHVPKAVNIPLGRYSGR